MTTLLIVLVLLVLTFIVGALFFRKNGAKINATANQVKTDVSNVANAVKSATNDVTGKSS